MNKLLCASLAITMVATINCLSAASYQIKPTAIWVDESRAHALFEEYSAEPITPNRTINVIEGDRFSLSNGKQSFLITSIDTEHGTIGVQVGNSNEVFTTKSHLEPNGPGVMFDGASIDQLVGVYSRLAKKSVLIHPETAAHQFSFTIPYGEKAQAVRVILGKFKEAETVIGSE